MERGTRSIFISYRDAQRLIEFFRVSKKIAPWKEAKVASRDLIDKLEYVGDIDYTPLRGYQLPVTDTEAKFIWDTMEVLNGN